MHGLGMFVEEHDRHGLVVQAAFRQMGMGADFSVGMETRQDCIGVEQFCNGFHFLVYATAHDQLSSYATEKQG
jgi:hypothetical protein